MQQAGWVKSAGAEKSRGAIGKRQRYALTAAGRHVLKAEARRILETADLVRAHRVFADES
jgi:DNA-binding PadR family transcriptional regulator